MTEDKVIALHDPDANTVIQITVRSETFQVRTHAESWRTMDESARKKWCEDMAQEFDRIHFDYREIKS